MHIKIDKNGTRNSSKSPRRFVSPTEQNTEYQNEKKKTIAITKRIDLSCVSSHDICRRNASLSCLHRCRTEFNWNICKRRNERATFDIYKSIALRRYATSDAASSNSYCHFDIHFVEMVRPRLNVKQNSGQNQQTSIKNANSSYAIR